MRTRTQRTDGLVIRRSIVVTDPALAPRLPPRPAVSFIACRLQAAGSHNSPEKNLDATVTPAMINL